MLFRSGSPDGAISKDGRISGSYLHGLFADDAFRSAWLEGLGVARSDIRYETKVDGVLDALADHMEAHLDIEGLLALAR